MTITLQSSGTAVFDAADIGHSYVYSGGAATTGNLLVLGVNCHNGTVTTPTGFTVATSDASAQGCYCFYKVAVGGETSSTITTSADREVALSYLRYSGSTATPLDIVQAVRIEGATTLLTDTFGSQDAAKWTYGTGTSATGGVMSFNVAGLATVTSANSYNARGGGSAVLKVIEGASSGFTLLLQDAGGHNLSFNTLFSGAQAYADNSYAGTIAGYTRGGTQWWRIRWTDATVYWEYGTDGVTWTVGYSQSIGSFNLASVSIVVQSTNGGTADNFTLTRTAQESPAVTPSALTTSGELAILYAMNNNSGSADAVSPTWPVAYTTRLDTGPSPRGAGSDHEVEHMLAARTDASGIEAPQIFWTGGQFVNRTALFVSFKSSGGTISLAGQADIEFGTSATITRTSRLAGQSDIAFGTTAAITKTTTTTVRTRIINIMTSVLTAVQTALISTPGGAITTAQLAPTADYVSVDNSLTVSVDREFRISTATFDPLTTDTAAAATYLVFVMAVGVFRSLADPAALTAAAGVIVGDAQAVLTTTMSTLAGLGDVHGYRSEGQSFGGNGSVLLCSVRIVL